MPLSYLTSPPRLAIGRSTLFGLRLQVHQELQIAVVRRWGCDVPGEVVCNVEVAQNPPKPWWETKITVRTKLSEPYLVMSRFRRK